MRCVDGTPAQRMVRVPGQRPEALSARRDPDLERVVPRSGHDVAIRQRGDARDLRPSRRGRAIDARFDWTPAPRWARVPGQRLDAGAGQRVPHLERAVLRPGHDAAVRQGGDAPDLPSSRRRRAIERVVSDWTPAPRFVRVPAQRRRAAEARKGSHGLRNKCSKHCIAWFFARAIFLFF